MNVGLALDLLLAFMAGWLVFGAIVGWLLPWADQADKTARPSKVKANVRG